MTATRRRIRMLDKEAQKRHKRMLSAQIGKRGLWPLNAPGMPPPGPDFLYAAEALGDATEYVKATKKNPAIFQPGRRLDELYGRALREPGFTLSIETRKGNREEVTFVPGHIWGQHSEAWVESRVDANIEAPRVDGPHPAEVLVLGKMPGRNEVRELRNLIGASGEILLDVIDKLHIRGARKWYVTNLVKFGIPESLGNTTLRAPWIHDCLPLLHQELRIVKPKYILCLGADASKWLLGEKFNVSYMAGRVVPYTFPMKWSSEDADEQHTAHVMTVLHPAEVSRSPEKVRILQSNMGRFASLITGMNFDLEEKGLDHRECSTLEDAEEWVDEVNAELNVLPKAQRFVAWDLEWQGQHPVNKGTYVRTIQASWGPKKAICFIIHHAGGKKAFRDRNGKPAINRLVKLLNGFMKGKRAVGHFLVSDLEWANHIGFEPINEGNRIPLYTDKEGRLPWQQLRAGQGWIDTAMLNHAIEETAPLGLETLTMRYTTAPRYDIALEDWKTQYCKEHKMKKEALEGYGDCPNHILVPYANYDADVTRRIAIELLPLLDSDYEKNCCWEPFWESMAIQKVILRMHKNGILVDRSRVDTLTKTFMKWRGKQEEKIRTTTKWPEFNIRSVQHVREFLFGTPLNGKRDNEGNSVRIRPKGAKSLAITPLLDTSKPPRRWDELVERGLAEHATPGTGKMILGILAQENLNVADDINMIRDHRFLDQVLKSVLRPPRLKDPDAKPGEVDPDDMYVENEDGFLEYDAGLAGSIDDDGRVRTHMYPTAETGRWKHSRPNLANISKSRDPDYARMLGGERINGKWVGGDYKYKLRSTLQSSPGYALIEFDYMGAELYGMAIMARAKRMQDHCVRALLPDEGFDAKGNKVDGGKFPHPNYYDIHSNVAKLAFRLDCVPTKGGLDSIGKSHFRTLAKNVIFGIAYGRGAKAIALSAKEQGIRVTVEEAQAVIDAIFEMYPELQPFFAEAESRALNEKWLCHCFGRFRRFPTTSDYKMEGEFARQAMNFPIQGMIASAVDRGLAYLDDGIEQQNLTNEIRMLLQMHDAGMVEARYDLIEHAIGLIKWAMVDMVEIHPTDLAGKPIEGGPFRLALEFEICNHWGERFSYEEAVKYSIPTKFAAKPKK